MKRIILVEDDQSIQDAMRMILEKEGYDIELHANAGNLLTEAANQPDLFILDKQLSGVDGLEICRMLKNRPASKKIPVIMLSANPDILRLAKAAGADDAIEKPFKMKDLKMIVSKYLNESTPLAAAG